MDPELKAKRKRLRELIKYFKDQDAWLVSRYGRHDQSALAKVKEYEQQLAALGNDGECDLLVQPPAAKDGPYDKQIKAYNEIQSRNPSEWTRRLNQLETNLDYAEEKGDTARVQSIRAQIQQHKALAK